MVGMEFKVYPLVLSTIADLEVVIMKTGLGRGSVGGYFCFLDEADAGEAVPPAPSLVARIGGVTGEKASELFVKALEKLHRLAGRPNDRTSYQSRNPGEHRWGGAVRAISSDHRYIFSFSGYPEEVDEAMMFALAVRLETMTLEEANALAANDSVRGALRTIIG